VTDTTHWVQALVTGIGDWPPVVAYSVLAASAFLENILPPVPGDLVVVVSAYLAGRGVLDWLPVYLSTCVGGTAGFLVMFQLGRTKGRALLQSNRHVSALFSSQRLTQAENWLARYGLWLILGNRFLSGIRSVIALAAGLCGMDWKPMATLGLLSMLLWNGALLYGGLQVGQNWEQVIAWLGRYNQIIGGLLILGGLLAVFRWRYRRTARRGSPVDSPSEGA
jgi:membrane protein DedA with SNARE-associated domain